MQRDVQNFRDKCSVIWHAIVMQLTFDTKQIYRDLSHGDLFSKKQAEKLTDTLRDVVNINAENLATKADIEQLRAEMEIMQQQLTIRLGGIMVVGIGVIAALQQFG